MGKMRTYEIGEGRLSRSVMEGMHMGEGGVLLTDGGRSGMSVSRLFLPALVAEQPGKRWGRIHLEYEPEEDSVCTVWAYAADRKEMGEALSGRRALAEGKAFLEQAGHRCGSNCRDMLLYDLQGKYLWILIEIGGMGRGILHDIRVEGTGDRFLDTFPEIYREEGGFFHRYLTVFSTLYEDLQKEIDSVHRLLDPDTAPLQLLYRYADWLGIALDGEFLVEPLARKLVRHGYALCRRKGTKESLSALVELVLGRKAVIVERGLLRVWLSEEEKAVYNRLYGCGAQDVTVLVHYQGGEQERAGLLFLLNQFRPARCRLRLVLYGDKSRMDTYCYMDRNARLCPMPETVIDRGAVML